MNIINIDSDNIYESKNNTNEKINNYDLYNSKFESKKNIFQYQKNISKKIKIKIFHAKIL